MELIGEFKLEFENRLDSLRSQRCAIMAMNIHSTLAQVPSIANVHFGRPSLLTYDGSNDIYPDNYTEAATQGPSDDSNNSCPVPTLKTCSSTDTMKHVPVHHTKVQFAASPYLQAVYQPYQYRTPTFQNPFSEQLEAQSRRASTTSQDSDDALPQAFARHRDTLARFVYNVEEDGDEEEGRNSCDYTPTQSSVTSSRRSHYLLRQHRDTLARLHFRQNCDKALPASILAAIATFLSINDYKNMRLTCRHWADNLPHPVHPMMRSSMQVNDA